MLAISLIDIAASCSGKLEGNDCLVSAITIDSRTVVAKSLFIAIKGEQVDGHHYIQSALDNGAVAALVEKRVDVNIPQIIVNDCIQALGLIAKYYRQLYRGIVFGITGSAGKTTTKEMLVSILSCAGSVVSTKGNQNNEIGVPLTIFNMDHQYQYAVIEMGAAQKGDIAYLMNIVNPNVVAITNIGSAHIGRFGSEQIIAETKSEIYRELVNSGAAVVNMNDKYAATWLEILKSKKVLKVGLGAANVDLLADTIQLGSESSQFQFHYHQKNIPIILAVPGEHNIINALCAAGLALQAGISLEEVAEGLHKFSAVSSRLEKLNGSWGGILIDDCYNANPISVKAAINVLSQYTARKIIILGDMAELGELSKASHADVGAYAKSHGIDVFISCGVDSYFASIAFDTNNTQHFLTKSSLIVFLQKFLLKDDVVLIKGSRSAALEEVVKFFKLEVNA